MSALPWGQWARLQADIGDCAQAEGVLLRFGSGYRLISSDSNLIEQPRGGLSASFSVGLQMEGDIRARADSLENASVRVEGIIDDHLLIVESIRSDRSARRNAMPVGLSPNESRVANVVGRRPAAVRDLMAEGVLLDLWVQKGSAGEEALEGIATDVGRAKDILQRHYCLPLNVFKSRWNMHDLEEVESMVGRATDLVVASGYDRGVDRQLRVSVSLLHLPTRVREQLLWCKDMLLLDVLLQPAHC